MMTGHEITSLKEHECEIKRIDFDHTGKRLISAGSDRTILVWDAAEHAVIQRFRVSSVPGSLVMFREGNLLATGDLRGGLNVWNWKNGQRVLRYVGHEGPVLGIALSPDGKLLATASHDGTIGLWPVAIPALKIE